MKDIDDRKRSNYPWKPDTKVATPAEMKELKKRRESGEISFFRVDHCLLCRAEIPKGKEFCSEDHAEQHSLI